MVKSFPTFLLLGDSLTEGAFGVDGYGSAMVADVSIISVCFDVVRDETGFVDEIFYQLLRQYAARCDVLNRGFGG